MIESAENVNIEAADICDVLEEEFKEQGYSDIDVKVVEQPTGDENVAFRHNDTDYVLVPNEGEYRFYRGDSEDPSGYSLIESFENVRASDLVNYLEED